MSDTGVRAETLLRAHEAERKRLQSAVAAVRAAVGKLTGSAENKAAADALRVVVDLAGAFAADSQQRDEEIRGVRDTALEEIRRARLERERESYYKDGEDDGEGRGGVPRGIVGKMGAFFAAAPGAY